MRNVTLMTRYEDEFGICTVADFIDKRFSLSPKQAHSLQVKAVWSGLLVAWRVDSSQSLPTVIKTKNWKLDMSQPTTVANIHQQILALATPGENVARTKWQQDLSIHDLEPLWGLILRKRLHINQIKLRMCYVRFVNRAYSLNTQLYEVKKIDSPNCTLCKEVRETWVHLFWECLKVQPLWQQAIAFCQKHVDNSESYTRDHCLIFGFRKPLVNLIITTCKQQIHLA